MFWFQLFALSGSKTSGMWCSMPFVAQGSSTRPLRSNKPSLIDFTRLPRATESKMPKAGAHATNISSAVQESCKTYVEIGATTRSTSLTIGNSNHTRNLQLPGGLPSLPNTWHPAIWGRHFLVSTRIQATDDSQMTPQGCNMQRLQAISSRSARWSSRRRTDSKCPCLAAKCNG